MPFRNEPHNRTLPDTNVWLDAAFVPNSVASRAVAAIRAASEAILIDDSIEREAFSVLERLRKSVPLNFDPSVRLIEYLSDIGCIRVPSAPPDIAVSRINRSDRHVARAAIHYRAALLTSDAALASQCQSEDIFTAFPWEILTRAGAPQGDIIRAMPIGTMGTIFARVTPGGWLGTQSGGKFTVVETRNLGWLYYDAGSLDYVFESTLGLEVRVRYSAGLQGQTVVCLTYELTGRRGTIILRAGRLGSNDSVTASRGTMKHLALTPGESRLGSRFDGTEFWNGFIRHVTIGPHGMSAEKWKAIISVENAAPNPLNHNALRLALEAIDRSQALPWF